MGNGFIISSLQKHTDRRKKRGEGGFMEEGIYTFNE